MARPFCSNGVKVEVYSWISFDREETEEEEESDRRVEETMLEEGASCIYGKNNKMGIVLYIIII